MRSVKLLRQKSDELSTPGTLLTDRGTVFVTLELPDKKNKSNVSCIPEGRYTVKMVTSPTHGRVYQVMNVPNRSNILIHSANIPSQLLGCIAVGKSVAVFNPGSIKGLKVPTKGISRSREALKQLEDEMSGEDFTLEIIFADIKKKV